MTRGAVSCAVVWSQIRLDQEGEPSTCHCCGDGRDASREEAPRDSDATCLSKRLDPLACPECGGQMKVVAFLEPPQGDVIEKILRHCGRWSPVSPRAPPTEARGVHDADGAPAASNAFRELTFVDEATFWSPF